MIDRRSAIRSVAAVSLLAAAACGTLRDGSRWSDHATLLPGTDRLLHAARDAALDPWTWAPLAGAGVIAAGGWDRDLSEWARRETPLFGSGKDANDAGKTLGSVTRDVWIASALATPSGDTPLAWAGDKLRGLSIEWGATLAASAATSELKGATNRDRPNGANQRSFPSSAAADAFAQNALFRENLDAIDAPWPIDAAVRIGMGATAAGMAWSRVEAGAHYPTDVLVGAAVGNFVARFVHDAFLGLPPSIRLEAVADPAARDFAIGFSFEF